MSDADLMPRYPVYVNLLPKSAQDVIAKPHPNAEAAKALLETQGFRYNSMVDIFDAGPCVECYTDSIEIVRSVERMSARDWAQADNDSRGLVSRGGFADFCVTSYLKGEDRLDVLSRLGVQSSDEILAFPYKEARKWRMKN